MKESMSMQEYDGDALPFNVERDQPTSPCSAGDPDVNEETCYFEESRCGYCGRTKADIVAWGEMSEAERKDRIRGLKQSGWF